MLSRILATAHPIVRLRRHLLASMAECRESDLACSMVFWSGVNSRNASAATDDSFCGNVGSDEGSESAVADICSAGVFCLADNDLLHQMLAILARKLIETIDDEDVEIVRMFACLYHWSRCSLSMFLVRLEPESKCSTSSACNIFL